MTAEEADQIPQSAGESEETGSSPVGRTKVLKWQIGPIPRNGGDAADAKSH